jgi:hypothetical protein
MFDREKHFMQTRFGGSAMELPVQPQTDAGELLREMFELLEDYAPSWYPEHLRARAAIALGAEAQ